MKSGPRPVRYFGSWMGFTCEYPGKWIGEFKGLKAEIERRRSEPGNPEGWYVFVPGGSGEYAGSVEDAADMAATKLDELAKRADAGETWIREW